MTESLCALIYQVLHLAKTLSFTDTSMKMVKNGRLSVKIQTFRTRFYGQITEKRWFVRKMRFAYGQTIQEAAFVRKFA